MQSERIDISGKGILKSLYYTLTTPKQLWRVLKTLIPYILIYISFLWVVDQFQVTPAVVREFFAGRGLMLAPLFIVVQLVVSLTPLPDLPFIAAGILFFEPWFAFTLIWLGMTLGSLINFMIARKVGREYVVYRYPRTAEWIDKFSGKYGFEAVVVGRAFTFVTFDLVAYTAGISPMPFKHFAFATMIGIIPVALNSTLVGMALTSLDVITGIQLFAISAGLALCLGWLAQRFSNWLESKP